MTTFTLATQAFQSGSVGTMIASTLFQILVSAKLTISFFGSMVILIGALLCAYRYSCYRFGSTRFNTDQIRLDLARSIILGLEFFVAADVIETTVAPDFRSLGILGLLVIIRTFLNFTLQQEVKKLSGEPTKLNP